MIFTLIGMVVLGVGVAGIFSLLFRLLGRRAPRGLLPIGAGLAMFGFVIWNDYSWYSRTSNALPESFQVAKTFTGKSALQPWTYLLAPVDRFMAVDMATRQRNPSLADMVLVQLHLVTRYQNTVSIWQLHDCQSPRRADIADAAQLDPATVEQLDWLAEEANDPLHQLACREPDT